MSERMSDERILNPVGFVDFLQTIPTDAEVALEYDRLWAEALWLEAEKARYRDALHSIIRHQETIVRGGRGFNTTLRIARGALDSEASVDRLARGDGHE